jgi:Protein of unknown function (DUF2889)
MHDRFDGSAPQRRPSSVRRTATLDMRWPGDPGSELVIEGTARDLLTDGRGHAEDVVGANLRVRLDPESRTIQDLRTTPAAPGTERLVGARGGGRLRSVLAESVPEEKRAGTPLHQLLDDLAGASLIAPFALMRRLGPAEWAQRFGSRRPATGVCLGFRRGATAHRSDEPRDRTRLAESLTDPADPDGWHPHDDTAGPVTRRARRMDVWLEDGIRVDSWFQDSATEPHGGRVAVHEYTLRAVIDPRTGRLLELDARPRALPYPECPLAVGNLERVVGTPLGELRDTVPQALRGAAGCTHLNDAVRALADASALAGHLAPKTAGGQ